MLKSVGLLQSCSQCLRAVVQSCLTLCDPMDCSPPGSSVCGISQARILEWVAVDGHLGVFLKQCHSEHWGACTLLDYGFLQISAQEWIIGSYRSSVFSFLRNFPTLLHSGCINLHFHQHCRRAPLLHTLSRICCSWTF